MEVKRKECFEKEIGFVLLKFVVELQMKKEVFLGFVKMEVVGDFRSNFNGIVGRLDWRYVNS